MWQESEVKWPNKQPIFLLIVHRPSHTHKHKPSCLQMGSPEPLAASWFHVEAKDFGKGCFWLSIWLSFHFSQLPAVSPSGHLRLLLFSEAVHRAPMIDPVMTPVSTEVAWHMESLPDWTVCILGSDSHPKCVNTNSHQALWISISSCITFTSE